MNHTLAPYALVLLRKEDKISLLQRSLQAKFAPDCFSIIGGSVEQNETFRQAVLREAREEVGVTIAEQDLYFVHVFYRKGTVSELVACVFECRVWQGEPYNREPEKHNVLQWFAIDQLPEKMIPAHRGVLGLIAQGVPYSEQP